MAKGFGYQAQVGGPFAYTQVSDSDCDAQYASFLATGALTNGLPVVFAIVWPTAVFNATFTAVTSSSGTPTFSGIFNPPAGVQNVPNLMLPITLANGANSNVAHNGASFLRIAGPSGAFSITGFVAGVDGQKLTIYNTTTQVLTLTHDATSTAANRIYNASGANIVMAASKGSAQFVYSVIDARWICINPLVTPA